MKKQFILLICVLSGYIGYAQQGIDVLDFIKNAPWDLTKSEIDAKYENSLLSRKSGQVGL